MKSLSTKNIILASIVFAVVIFTGALLMSKNNINSEKTLDVATPITETKVLEEVKDGVYTNYTYGFKYKFSSIVFSKIGGPLNNRAYVVDESNSSDASAWLSPMYSEATSSDMQLFESEWEFSDKVRLNNIDIGQYRCVRYYVPADLTADGIEPSWGYLFSCLKGKNIIGVGLFTDESEDILKSYNQTFDAILTSFSISQ